MTQLLCVRLACNQGQGSAPPTLHATTQLPVPPLLLKDTFEISMPL